MALAGRSREVRAIDHLLGRTRDGCGGHLVFHGPPGSGKTALLEAAAERGRRAGFEVFRASAARGQAGRLVWVQLLRAIPGQEALAGRLLDEPSLLELDSAGRELASGERRLILVDDLDKGGPQATELLAILATRLPTTSTAVIATTSTPLGLGADHGLPPLNETDIAAIAPRHSQDAQHALWVASRGLPGLARALAIELAEIGPNVDASVHLALHAVSTAAFLETDVGLIRLLEVAVARTSDDATRARLGARLAHELLGDGAAAGRRRALVDQALMDARRSGDPSAMAQVLDARLHALWDPGAAEDRLATAAQIIALAQTVGDQSRERHGLFWRFVALMELGRVGEAEVVLAAYERAADAAGDAEGVVMARARHVMLAVLHGSFDVADRLIDKVVELGHRIGLADTDRLSATLRGAIVMERGSRTEWAFAADELTEFSRRVPGQYFDATAAQLLTVLGRENEASVILQRLLPHVLDGSGPRWLCAMTSLAVVAAATRNGAAAASLYTALVPYRGRLVVAGGANTAWGPVSHYLALLATQLGNLDIAVRELEVAIGWEEQAGALPFLAHSLAALAGTLNQRAQGDDRQRASDSRTRARDLAQRLGMPLLLERLAPSSDSWSLVGDGEDWLLQAGSERARLRNSHGLRYLRALLAAPGREIDALELVAGGGGLVGASDGPVVDTTALAAYRTRLGVLSRELDSADQMGDRQRGEAVELERRVLVNELRRASGLGRRVRQTSPEVERARVNVTRTLRATIDRLAMTAPRAAAHLNRSIRTGRACCYTPVPDGPPGWHL
jgi:hypothetical protein